MSSVSRLYHWIKARPILFWSRSISLVVAMGCLTILALSAWLEPSAAGHSTHLQLGLAPCSLLSWTGIPCPMCGATTTFALLAHFRFLEGVVNQPFAALLYVMTVTAFVISVMEALRPRNRWAALYKRIEPWEGISAVAFLALMAIGWIYKILSMGGFFSI